MNPPPAYGGLLLPDEPSLEVVVETVVDDYRALCLTNLRAVLDRFEARPDYPFVDTKLDLSSDRDFAVDDPIRGLEAVYGWIQGRGLEALAGHGQWLRDSSSTVTDGVDLLPRIEDMLRAVLARVRQVRERNNGHLFFLMRSDGTPLVLDDAGVPTATALTSDAPWSFSDLFTAKGMLAAAMFLDDGPARAEALRYCIHVEEAIHSGDFITDQQPLDPANPVRPVEGKFGHGARMISLGAVAVRARSGDPQALAAGLRLLEYELENHIAVPGVYDGQLERFDFWEAIDGDGQPYREAGGAVICDPGHALEFAGLAASMIRALRLAGPVPEDETALSAAEALLPPLVDHIFELGFQPAAGGICKSVDLVSRRPLNTDMPWWPLPETIRAAAYCCELSADEESNRSALRVLAACHNAFTRHFVRPDVHLMAVQMRAVDGSVSSAIPATADADPGYHTGLSLIDTMETLLRLTG